MEFVIIALYRTHLIQYIKLHLDIKIIIQCFPFMTMNFIEPGITIISKK